MDIASFSRLLTSWHTKLPTTITGTSTRLAGSLLQHFQQNFKEGGYEKDSTFIPWAKRKYSLNQPLLKTGKLASGFTAHVTANGVVIENTVAYAPYINDGTPTMPARPLLYDSELIEKQIIATVTLELSKLFT